MAFSVHVACSPVFDLRRAPNFDVDVVVQVAEGDEGCDAVDSCFIETEKFGYLKLNDISIFDLGKSTY